MIKILTYWFLIGALVFAFPNFMLIMILRNIDIGDNPLGWFFLVYVLSFFVVFLAWGLISFSMNIIG